MLILKIMFVLFVALSESTIPDASIEPSQLPRIETLSFPARKKIGRYEICSQLGAGGMGEVYLANDTKLDRKVALKILPSDVVEAKSGDRVRRFVQEAKAASALNHPNILTIYEIDEIDSEQFIATEFIDGETLRERIRTCAVQAARRARRWHPGRQRPWLQLTASASSIATSSLTTSCCAATASLKSSTLVSPNSLANAKPPKLTRSRPRKTSSTPGSALCWAPRTTCHPNKREDSKSTHAATSGVSVVCSTK